MAKSNNQKAKILYLAKMMQASGENHMMTMQEILAELGQQGIRAERKSIYDDMEALRDFGMDIQYRRGKQGGYFLAGQQGSVAAQPTMPQPEKQEKDAAETKPEREAAEAKPFKLLCASDRRDEIQAFLGSSAKYKDKESGSFVATVPLCEGPRLYGWLTSMGTDVRILKPKKAARAYREYLKMLAKEYK